MMTNYGLANFDNLVNSTGFIFFTFTLQVSLFDLAAVA